MENLEREINAIERGYLHCSAFVDLNDPMEGLFSSSHQLRNKARYRGIRNSIVSRKDETGICSFSETYDHELMWAHYANKFRGVCVAYSLSRLLKNLPRGVTFVRLYYNESVPTIRTANKQPGELAQMVLSYKNYRWIYEREWRMFAKLGNVSYGDANCVTRVYLGSRMEVERRHEIIDRLKSLGIKTSEMAIDKYAISFEPTRRS